MPMAKIILCQICAVEIPAKQDGAGRRGTYCSQNCRRQSEGFLSAKRANKARRRAIRKGTDRTDRFDPYQIFVRDRWFCQLCGVKTPEPLRGQMVWNSPELDHIVPLAKGGTHTWDNVQCACRQCNGQKGAKPLGQPRLRLTHLDPIIKAVVGTQWHAPKIEIAAALTYPRAYSDEIFNWHGVWRS